LAYDETVEAARLLARLMERRYTFLASTDFTHYGASFGYLPFPVDERTPQQLRSLDQQIIQSMGTLDRSQFQAVLRDTSSTMCGYLPVQLLLELLKTNTPDCQQRTLDYQTSGEITGDYTQCVSYAALAYSRPQ
jgi:AmmeMemoRadiSam system protein B